MQFSRREILDRIVPPEHYATLQLVEDCRQVIASSHSDNTGSYMEAWPWVEYVLRGQENEVFCVTMDDNSVFFDDEVFFHTNELNENVFTNLVRSLFRMCTPALVPVGDAWRHVSVGDLGPRMAHRIEYLLSCDIQWVKLWIQLACYCARATPDVGPAEPPLPTPLHQLMWAGCDRGAPCGQRMLDGLDYSNTLWALASLISGVGRDH